MQLNLKKCIFKVKTKKFQGYYLTEKSIKVNLDKCKDMIDMANSKTKREIQ